jgi:hypothetical protein
MAPSPENEMVITAKGPEANLTNDEYWYLNSVAKNIELVLKIPLEPSLTKQLCNWSIKVTVERGVVNINK